MPRPKRTATCIAKTDVALAVLKVEDFKFVTAKYVEFTKRSGGGVASDNCKLDPQYNRTKLH
jgi:hypothetical protein